MRQEHTPGPWKIDDALEHPLAIIQDEEDGTGICEVGNAEVKRDQAHPESWANARLIAKSPEMYEFIEGIALEGCCQTEGCSEDEPRCSATRARALLRDIAKATGQTNDPDQPRADHMAEMHVGEPNADCDLCEQ